jgi:large subunit ribosomal protein L21
VSSGENTSKLTGLEPVDIISACGRSRPQFVYAVFRRDLSVYAVVETGGKQYRVAVGDRITVERLAAEPGAEVTLDRVLLVEQDGDVKIGTPVVDGAKVIANVDAQSKGKKLIVFKMRPKKRYRRKTGHRQQQTELTIKDIVA